MATYRSAINEHVPLARPDEFRPIDYRAFEIWPPVVLAPMAGVTNPPFRTLCRRYGAGLYVSEMIAARGLVEGNKKTEWLSQFFDGEYPRSNQLYGTDPRYLGEATRHLVGEGRVDHLDLNFGCPVPKVTARGGGSAIPLKPRLMAKLVRAVVSAAGAVPVTVKVRLGIDDEHLTYLSSGRVAEEEGCVAIGLHARTAAQLYDGAARWEAIAELKRAVTIPVLGNGDIWEAFDALRMLRVTGCDGVIVGRGCLGRPWLFRDLADVFNGREPEPHPTLGGVVEVMHEHSHLLMQFMPEFLAMRHMRKWSNWYTKGFPGSAPMRVRLNQIKTYADLCAILDELPEDEPFPVLAMRVSRAKRSGTQTVALPPGYLDQLGDDTCPIEPQGEELAAYERAAEGG
jgi:nifR3 family TIM-barrel protein